MPPADSASLSSRHNKSLCNTGCGQAHYSCIDLLRCKLDDEQQDGEATYLEEAEEIDVDYCMADEDHDVQAITMIQRNITTENE
mgnify:CR=1 FL=1